MFGTDWGKTQAFRKATQDDNSTMKLLALLGTVYLPATFVSVSSLNLHYQLRCADNRSNTHSTRE